MSCIPKILALKGDKEFLPIHDDPSRADSGAVVEGGGEYKGYHYVVTFTGCGHRCGYVALPPEHLLSNKEYQLTCKSPPEPFSDLSVHGGITFHEEGDHILDKLFPNEPKCTDVWIGFDAAHYMDGRDWDHHEKYFGKKARNELEACGAEFRYLLGRKETVRTYEYMENQCKELIDQIVEKDAA